jgi:hypothetical protein
MTTQDKILVSSLLEGWQRCFHNRDILFQLVQVVPDWEKKLTQALNDPARIHATENRFVSLKRAVIEIMEGGASLPALERAVQDLKKPLH